MAYGKMKSKGGKKAKTTSSKGGSKLTMNHAGTGPEPVLNFDERSPANKKKRTDMC